MNEKKKFTGSEKMDAKEAIEIVKENIQQVKELQNRLTGRMNTACQRDIDGLLAAISALEKVETLEAENARLKDDNALLWNNFIHLFDTVDTSNNVDFFNGNVNLALNNVREFRFKY